MSNPTLMQFKLNCFAKKYGLTTKDLNKENLLNIAHGAEEKCKQLGAFDVAFPRFKQVQLDYENAAKNLDDLQLQAA